MVEVQKLPLILVREYIKLLLFIRIGVKFREKRWILCDEHKCLASTFDMPHELSFAPRSLFLPHAFIRHFGGAHAIYKPNQTLQNDWNEKNMREI